MILNIAGTTDAGNKNGAILQQYMNATFGYKIDAKNTLKFTAKFMMENVIFH